MNVFKKFAAMTLASAVVLGTLAGCGSSGGGDTAAAGSGAAAGTTAGTKRKFRRTAAQSPGTGATGFRAFAPESRKFSVEMYLLRWRTHRNDARVLWSVQ